MKTKVKLSKREALLARVAREAEEKKRLRVSASSVLVPTWASETVIDQIMETLSELGFSVRRAEDVGRPTIIYQQ